MIYSGSTNCVANVFSDISEKIDKRFDLITRDIVEQTDRIVFDNALDYARHVIDRLLVDANTDIQHILFETIGETAIFVNELNECADEELIERINKDVEVFVFIANPSETVKAFYQFKTKL